MVFSIAVVSTATRFKLWSVIAPKRRPASIALVSRHSTPILLQRGRITRRAVLNERLNGEMLAVGVLHPTGDNSLVRQLERVLQIHQPGDQPSRSRRTARCRRNEPAHYRSKNAQSISANRFTNSCRGSTNGGAEDHFVRGPENRASSAIRNCRVFASRLRNPAIL